MLSHQPRHGFRAGVMIVLLLSAASARLPVEITGTEAVPARKLRRQLPDKPDTVSRQAEESWARRAENLLLSWYRQRGFLDAAVSATIESQGEEEDRRQVLFDIIEGPQYRYGDVAVEATDSAGDIIATSRLQTRPGREYRRDYLFTDRRTIQQAFGNAGYLHADVNDSVVVHGDTALVDVLFRVEPGYLVRFDTLLVDNVRDDTTVAVDGLTDSTLFASLVPYSQGDTVRLAINDGIVEKLQATGAFVLVRLRDSLLSTEPSTSALLLRAVESVPGEFSAALYYETHYGPGLSATITHGNIGGWLKQLRGAGTFSLRRQAVELDFGSPITFGTPFRVDNELTFLWRQSSDLHQRLDTRPFLGDFQATNVTKLSRPTEHWFRYVGSTELLAKSTRTSRRSWQEGFTLNLINTGHASFVDEVVDPSRGSRYSLSAGIGGIIEAHRGLSAFRHLHTWLELQSSYYISVLPQVVIAMRLDGGHFFNEARINADRFFLGGPRSVRSFGFNELCPDKSQDGVCDPSGLTPAYYLTALEIRLRPFAFGPKSASRWDQIVRPLGIVGLVDYGNVWDVEEPFGAQQSGEGIAYGFGLRYPLLGMFDLRLDFAWGEDGKGREAFGFVVDLAQAF
jgi:outer membrane protein insertion porin family